MNSKPLTQAEVMDAVRCAESFVFKGFSPVLRERLTERALSHRPAEPGCTRLARICTQFAMSLVTVDGQRATAEYELEQLRKRNMELHRELAHWRGRCVESVASGGVRTAKIGGGK